MWRRTSACDSRRYQLSIWAIVEFKGLAKCVDKGGDLGSVRTSQTGGADAATISGKNINTPERHTSGNRRGRWARFGHRLGVIAAGALITGPLLI